jgi:carbonic anhydrase
MSKENIKKMSSELSQEKSEKQKRGYQELLQGNRDWVKTELDRDPDYFN